jgi:hypothetical protein
MKPNVSGAAMSSPPITIKATGTEVFKTVLATSESSVSVP